MAQTITITETNPAITISTTSDAITVTQVVQTITQSTDVVEVGTSDHTALSNIGTRTHAQIDTDIDTLQAGGSSLPAAGTTGQVLKKIDGTDYNVEWAEDIDTDTGSITYSQATQPGSTVEGDMWFKTITGQLLTYSEGSWKSMTLDGENF